jgi:hypothetical protein
MSNVVLNDTATQPDPTLTASVGGIHFSINAVHTKEGFLYFTNTALGFFSVCQFIMMGFRLGMLRFWLNLFLGTALRLIARVMHMLREGELILPERLHPQEGGFSGL